MTADIALTVDVALCLPAGGCGHAPSTTWHDCTGTVDVYRQVAVAMHPVLSFEGTGQQEGQEDGVTQEAAWGGGRQRGQEKG